MATNALDFAPFWLRLLAGLAAGAATWVVAADYGTALVSRWFTLEHPAARISVGAAVGYAVIGSTVGVLGLFGAIHAAVLVLLLGAAITIRLPAYVRRSKASLMGWAAARTAFRRLDIGSRAALAVIMAAVATTVIGAALPAVWWDPIAYHLPLAAAALWHGSFRFDPQMVQSGFPSLGEAAALPAYAVAGSAGAAMATLGAGAFAALAVWGLADELSAGSGILAAMLVMSSGLWLWLAPSFYVDIPFALFVVAAIITVFELPRKPEQIFPIAAVAGALCGAAAAVKYSGLAAALVVFALALWVASGDRYRLLVGYFAGFVLVAAGWYLRTFVVTGDPLYPFLSTSIAKSPGAREFAWRYVDMTRHWCGGGTSLADLASLPYRLIVEPRAFCGDPGFALRAGIVLGIAALLLVRPARRVASVAAVLTGFWFASSQQWRFLLPGLFLYAAVVAAGAFAASDRLRVTSALALSVLAFYTILTNWMPQTKSEAQASIVPAFAYIAGTQSAAEYLGSRLETFGAAQWAAGRGIRGDQIIALDDVRDYYFPRGTAWANPYYQQTLRLNWQSSARARYKLLRDRGIRYMVVNANIAYVHRTPTGIDWHVLEADQHSGLRSVFSANGVTVYDLGGAQ